MSRNASHETNNGGKHSDVLRTIFGRTLLPKQLVNDNGSQFTSERFREFTKINGIRYKTSPPWHPATNSQAERFVQTFKMGNEIGNYRWRFNIQENSELLVSIQGIPKCHDQRNTCKIVSWTKPAHTTWNLIKPSVQEHSAKRAIRRSRGQQKSPVQCWRKCHGARLQGRF